jgi:hypothetical protein
MSAWQQSTGAIAAAIISGKSIIIYDKLGNKCGQIVFHSGDRLLGYTESTVSILSGHTASVYSEAGKLLFSVYGGHVKKAATGQPVQDDWQSQ